VDSPRIAVYRDQLVPTEEGGSKMANVITQPKIKTSSSTLALRPGTVADSYAVFEVFEHTFSDLSQRLGSTTPTSATDPVALVRMWEERRPLYEHLANTAEHFWVAEQEDRVIGFARSILRDGLRQLTELFVLPSQQSSGVGRELAARVFPTEGAAHRSIIATPDSRAQTLYLRAGVYPRFPIYYFGRKPEPIAVATDLKIEPIEVSSESIELLGQVDLALLGHRRDVDHAWLLTDRQGYLYYRGGQPVGYGYLGPSNGPFALIDASDFPAVLAHAEREAAKNNREFGIEVPMINQTAVDYLLGRGFKMDWFLAIFMSDIPFGKFENYIVSSPPFFL
jgi:GNAT superfamily N-acetyltransferase